MRLSLRDNLIKWVQFSAVSTSVRAFTFHENAFPKVPCRFEPNSVWDIRTMRPCQDVLPVRVRPSKRAWGQITSKSGIFFKNLFVRIYIADSTEINTGVSGACLDVISSSAWRFAPGKKGPGGVPLFSQWKFRMRHQGIDVSSACAPSVNPPSSKVLGDSQIPIYLWKFKQDWQNV